MAYNKTFNSEKKEYSIRTQSYAEDLIPEAVLDVNDPVYQIKNPAGNNLDQLKQTGILEWARL